MNRSKRGMAKVSVLWLIVILMFGLAGWAWSFLIGGELENQRQQVAALEVAKKDSDERAKHASAEYVNLSQVIGFGADAAAARADVKTATDALAALKADGTTKDLVGDPSVKTIQQAIPLLVQAYTSQSERANNAETQAKNFQTELDQARSNLTEVTSKKDAEIADLSRQLADKEQASKDLEASLRGEIAAAQEQVRDRDSKRIQAETTLSSSKKEHEDTVSALQGRMTEMGRKLQPFVREPSAADGKVLSVSKDLGLGWINLGAQNRLPVGARFTIVSGAVGSTRVKAMAEVTKVEGEMSEVLISEQTDPYDPPVAGDIVYNPVYDPSGERTALLLGSFSGKYSKTQLEALLLSMGVKVAPKLDNSVDFLIVGGETYVDDNGQPLETAQNPAESPLYKSAVAQGVQVVDLKDLRNYFRF